jgi:polar amino acid transport system substrate-binding protein
MPRALAVMLTACSLTAGALAGCAQQAQPEPVRPRVTPPLIRESGVLRVGVDAGYPPFAGVVEGSRTVGLDVDVAAAIAEKLGLRLEVVDVRPAVLGRALRDREVDIALGARPIADAMLADAAFAGSYLTDAPGFFSTKDTSVTVGTLGEWRVVVQQSSPAYWAMRGGVKPERLLATPTLRAAFQEMVDGRAEVVAGDAVVGAYIARDFPGVRFAGQIGEGVPLGVAVSREATGFEPVVRRALDELASTGVLDAIRGKWLGDLPALTVSGATDTTQSP